MKKNGIWLPPLGDTGWFKNLNLQKNENCGDQGRYGGSTGKVNDQAIDKSKTMPLFRISSGTHATL